MAVKWDKVEVRLATGEIAEATAPIIISASRSTDIPAFYPEWLVNRLAAGYAAWINPFNGKKSYVSFSRARLLVFWSKNPHPLLGQLDHIEELGFHNYYFQYTLNDYENEKLEPYVPPIKDRIETMRKIADRVGAERVVWRFDPLLLSGNISIPILVDRIRRIRDGVSGCTRRLVISFLDLARYKKVQQNLERVKIAIREFTLDEMRELAAAVSEVARESGLSVGTCAEEIDLADYGIEHNRCIDDRLIIGCFNKDRELMSFLGMAPSAVALSQQKKGPLEARRNVKDSRQRAACGCIASKDIGRYNTCPHMCIYCYANGSAAQVQKCRETLDPSADLL